MLSYTIVTCIVLFQTKLSSYSLTYRNRCLFYVLSFQVLYIDFRICLEFKVNLWSVCICLPIYSLITVCESTPVVNLFFKRSDTMLSSPVIIVTFGPRELTRERREEISERPGQNNVVVTVEEEDNDQGR